MRKGLMALLLVILALPLLLWLSLPWTAQYLLQQWLLQQGFQRPQLQLQHPSWRQLRIDHFSAVQLSQGRRLVLDVDNLDIRFSPLALLQGQLEELRIEQARLSIEADASIRGRLDQLEQQIDSLQLNRFHPAQLFQYAPSQRLVIGQLQLDYRAPEQPRWQARGNIDLEPELLQGRMQLLRNDDALGYLDLNFDPELNLALSLSRDNLYLLRSSHRLETDEDAWLLGSNLLLDVAQLSDWLQRLEPELELPVADPAGKLRLNTTMRLPNPLPTQLPELINQLEAELDGEIKLNTASGQGFGGSQAALQLSSRLQAGQFSLTLAENSRLSADSIQQPGLRLAHVEASLSQALQLEGHWQSPHDWQLSGLQLNIAPQGLTLEQPIQLSLQPIRLSVAEGPLLRTHYPLRLELPDIKLQPAGQPAVNLSVLSDLQLDTAQPEVSLQAKINTRQLPLQLNVNGQLQRDLNGQFDLTLASTSVAELHRALRPWLPTELRPLSVQQGNLSAQGNARISGSSWSLDATPVVHGLNLTWDEHTRIVDLNLTQRLRLDSQGQVRSSGKLEIDHTDSGVRIFGPQLDFDLSLPAAGTPRLSLSSFSLSALDGIIAVPPLSFNPLNPVFETRIAVSALELERLLELYPQEGLYGSGVLGGALPMRIEGNQLSIRGGQLVSQGEGGVIRYRPTPEVRLMGQQNPGIQLALDALTDLRFDLLDLTLDYQPNGDALISARLKGYNPSWQQGRPVDLNLNIEENLLDLLRTLRLTDNVTNAIDRRFRR